MTDKPGSIEDPDDLSGDAFLLYSDNRGLSAARANRQGLEDYAMTPATASASTQPRSASSDRPGANPAGSPWWGARTGFDHVYDQPDPRGYFQAFGPFGYQTPHHAQQVFRRLVAALTPNNVGRRVTALDICCSYGINAALLNHDLTLADLCARYTGPETTTLSVEDLLSADQVFYAVHRHSMGPLARVIGLDPARNAIDYLWWLARLTWRVVLVVYCSPAGRCGLDGYCHRACGAGHQRDQAGCAVHAVIAGYGHDHRVCWRPAI